MTKTFYSRLKCPTVSPLRCVRCSMSLLVIGSGSNKPLYYMRNCKYNLSMVTCSECVKVHALLAYVHTYVRVAPFCVLGISCLCIGEKELHSCRRYVWIRVMIYMVNLPLAVFSYHMYYCSVVVAMCTSSQVAVRGCSHNPCILYIQYAYLHSFTFLSAAVHHLATSATCLALLGTYSTIQYVPGNFLCELSHLSMTTCMK